MSILSRLRAIEVDKNEDHLFGIKSAILFGHDKDKNESYPLLYITRPKHISKEDFDMLLECIELRVPQQPQKTTINLKP